MQARKQKEALKKMWAMDEKEAKEEHEAARKALFEQEEAPASC